MTRFGFVLIGLGWLPVIAVALWWSGFAPFPQRPAEGLIEQSFYYSAQMHPDYIQERVAGADKPTPKQCTDSRTESPWPPEMPFQRVCWRQETAPMYGFGSPRWALTSTSYVPPPNPHNYSSGRLVVMAFTRSYAACMWKKKALDDDTAAIGRWNIEHSPSHTLGEVRYFSDCTEVPK